jgi:ferric-dicitrate binding protein FerR (iron transport regulator)
MEDAYETYKTGDFLEDAFFLQWVRDKDAAAEAFWLKWIGKKPANLQQMQMAKEQLRIIFSVQEVSPEAGDQEQVWLNIRSSIEANEKNVFRITRARRWLVAASIVAVILVGGLLWFVLYNNSKIVSTKFGQLKSVNLPDASEITMNAHSTIRYLKKWPDGQPREVWLKGEAFFKIRHLHNGTAPMKPQERFVVHTDHILVEVLGTVFNIKERRGNVQVSLESGSVLVKLRSDSLKKLVLLPGELASYNSLTNKLEKTVKDPAISRAWTEQKILTSNTSVAEIVQILEDTYGYKVILEDTTLAGKRIDGTLPMKNEQNLLFALSQVLNVDIEIKDSLLTIKRRD